MKIKSLLFFHIVFSFVFLYSKSVYSEDIVSFEFDTDLSSLLLLDRDSNSKFASVMRRSGLSYFHFIKVSSGNDRVTSSQRRWFREFEHKVLEVARQINNLMEGGVQIFANKRQYSLTNSRNMIVIYGFYRVEELFMLHEDFLKKNTFIGKMYEFAKSQVVVQSLKNKSCLQFTVNDGQALVGSIFLVSLQEDPPKHLNCIEEKLIESLGLFGNQKLLKDYQEGSFERRVLKELYLTDKYSGINFFKLNEISR